MKSRFTLAIYTFLIFISGCNKPAIDKEWLQLLSNDGLAVMFSVFVIFVILPSIGLFIWKCTSWAGKRIDKVIDRHTTFLDEMSELNRQIAKNLAIIETNLEQIDIRLSRLENKHREKEDE